MGMVKKIALITGSTSGIGLSIAQTFAKAGNSVVLTGRAEQKDIFREILDFKKQYHDRVTFVHGDLTDTNSVLELCRDITNIHSRGVDILVNNAGFQYSSPIEQHDLQIWNDMLSVHMTAPFLLIQHFLPYMKRKGWGRIVNIAAIHGTQGESGKVSFCASKAGLIGLTKTVALEANSHGVTCNAVCPGEIETEYADNQVKASAESKCKGIDKTKIASLVFHLCSDDATNITGETIPADGKTYSNKDIRLSAKDQSKY